MEISTERENSKKETFHPPVQEVGTLLQTLKSVL
jgi:hypothetical protein